MARGGKRPGAGRPRKPLSERIDEGIGVVRHEPPKVLDFPDKKEGAEDGDYKTPPFLEMATKESRPFPELPTSAEIAEQILGWVKDAGCERYVPKNLIEEYAILRHAFLECEYTNRQIGRTVLDGKATPSHYVKFAIEYSRQSMNVYREIYAIVAQNSTKDYGGNKGNTFLNMLNNRGF